MKPKIFTSSFLLLLSYTLCAQDDPVTARLTGPYLGQKPPGMTPGTGFFNKNQDIFGFGIFTMTKQSMC